MKTNIVAVAIASALIGAGMVASVQSLAQHDQHTGHKTTTQTKSNSPSMQMHQAMRSMDHSKMTGDVDRDFAMMMAEHHGSAIKMIDIYMKSGKSEALKGMARKMKAAQLKEKAELQKHAKMKH